MLTYQGERNMTYNSAREYIENLRGRGIVPGLANIEKLCAKLGDPQNKLRFIHISGTNGKGSVGAFLESILRNAGFKTARFVSPAVNDYLEMYTISGYPVSENDYAECVSKIKDVLNGSESENFFPTSFEAETAIAFLLFEKYMPDYVIIECGMGGLLDSTNVIPPPELAVITSISTDHASFLGDTIEDIAFQKSGIIKPYVKTVTCNTDTVIRGVIEAACRKNNAELFYTDAPYDISYGDNTEFLYKGYRYSIPLKGTYQVSNASLAIEAASIIGIDNDIISKGLKNTIWDFRFEPVGKYILDGAHNPDAAYQLSLSIEKYLNGKSTAFITGIFKDKDCEKIAKITASHADIIYTVSPPAPRGMNSKALAEIFKKYNSNSHDGISLDNAINLTKDYDSVVIFGSLSILSEAKRIIQMKGL